MKNYDINTTIETLKGPVASIIDSIIKALSDKKVNLADLPYVFSIFTALFEIKSKLPELKLEITDLDSHEIKLIFSAAIDTIFDKIADRS